MIQILIGDCLAILPTLPAASVQCCVTSPPYWGLRDYGCGGQLGLEATPQEYVAKMVGVFREVWRVLKDDGTLWVNMGDSYAHGECRGKSPFDKRVDNLGGGNPRGRTTKSTLSPGLKPKDFCGIPWRLAFALQADGWYLRSDIIWHKPNPMPESVTDRPTKAHEYIFLLSKREKYFYDADAIMEKAEGVTGGGFSLKYHAEQRKVISGGNPSNDLAGISFNFRNKRTVWTVATQPYSEAHFATFPEDLIKPCILAGSKLGDTVLDPFAGSGTTGKVAIEFGRSAILIELNPDYAELARNRTHVTVGML